MYAINNTNILIIYDSVFGNTAKIASAIKDGFGENANVKLLKISDVNIEQLTNANIVIVGSPTRQFKPTKDISDYLNSIPSKVLKGKSVAAFDTRLQLDKIDSKFLRFMVDKGGYAAKAIAKHLKRKGGNLLLPPEGFLVTDEEGPLGVGEEERAMAWIKYFS